MLLDPGSPFLELSQLAAHGMYDGEAPRPGSITGVGRISGRECVIVCNDATVKGGTYYPMTVKKHLRAQEIARENRLPCIYLVDSGGAHLPSQDEVFPDREHFGRIFYNQATLSAAGIPQIAVVMGSCTAGGAYVPAMSDESIIVRKQGTIFLGGPPLVKPRPARWSAPRSSAAATCTRASPGSPIICAENDEHALAHRAPHRRRSDRRPSAASWRRRRASRSYAAEELYGIMPADPRKPFDVREIIARLVDGSEFDEFKPRYGTTLVTGFAHIAGMPVGIIANNGILFSESALKGAHFIELCCQRRMPLLFLQNITGFMVGRTYEHEGIAKHGAKMVTAVACAQVPKFTVHHRRQLRRRQLRHVRPRLRSALPVDVAQRAHQCDGRRAGGERARDRAARRARGPGQSWSEEEEERFKAPIRAQYEQQGHPYYATARLWDDGVIDPARDAACARAGARQPRAHAPSAADPLRRVPDVRAHACSASS